MRNTYKFNQKPNINIDTIQKDGKNIQIISIWNRYDKPYFQVNGTGQMNSVIMTRNNSASVNATPQEIEELYKYRFRIDEDIKTKIFRSLLTDIRNWRCYYIASNQRLEAYYLKDPSYKIVTTKKDLDKMQIYYVEICHNATTIFPLLAMHYVTGAFIPVPFMTPIDIRIKGGIQYNVALLLNMYTQIYPATKTIDNFRETFEKACEENGIIWK